MITSHYIQLAEAMNDCFTAICDTLDSKLPPQNSSVDTLHSNAFEQSFYLFTVSIYEIIKIISKL